jgi:hypothetical protein
MPSKGYIEISETQTVSQVEAQNEEQNGDKTKSPSCVKILLGWAGLIVVIFVPLIGLWMLVGYTYVPTNNVGKL